MVSRFLNYVEIRTKITSLFAFLMTIAYLTYREQPIDWKLTGLFFAGMLLFDLTTTAINNYIDTKSNDQVLPFERPKALAILVTLLVFSTIAGLTLVYFTDAVVLLTGGFCFLVGIFYTFGPVPISRQPLGELLSGLLYGLFIPFLLLYINMPAGTYLSLYLGFDIIRLQVHVVPVLTLLLLSVNPVCATANIMLANNICDLEKDVLVKRFTLPYYLGARSLDLFAWIYYIAYGTTLVMILFGMLPLTCLLMLLTIWPIRKNIQVFRQKQEKETTFSVSIKNYVILMGSLTVTIFLGGMIS
ncbi:MAG: prenyltransferase [Firmicutes bacterium HGW-Firmicutes-11]|jgi:1,4-dihydroxy-2-naphthoate octaprenyltransferase|nr:MAG: prenyltransferase [Firmicutes bacterium HGW-Firmicutes-11]